MEKWLYAIQPTVFPSIVQMERIARCHVLVLMDDSAFSDFHTKVSLMTREGILSTRVPVSSKHRDGRIFSDVATVDIERYRTKFLRSLQMIYGKQEGYRELWKPVSSLLYLSWVDGVSIMKVATATMMLCMDLLGLKQELLLASEVMKEGRPSGRFLIPELCKRVGATDYYQGAALKAYADRNSFTECGVTPWVQNYEVPRYQQVGNRPFDPAVSILDALMVGGKELGRRVVRTDAGRGWAPGMEKWEDEIVERDSGSPAR